MRRGSSKTDDPIVPCDRCGQSAYISDKCYWGCVHPTCAKCIPFFRRWQHA